MKYQYLLKKRMKIVCFFQVMDSYIMEIFEMTGFTDLVPAE